VLPYARSNCGTILGVSRRVANSGQSCVTA
jgi:hypothetical protein